MLMRVSLSRVWMAAAIALPLVIITAGRLDMVDLAYHLRAGAMMIASGTVVRTDAFTFTALGAPWVDQQWVSQILLALVFRAGGWLALVCMQLVLAGLSLAMLFASSRARGATVRRAAWLTMAGACLLLPSLTLRPQLLGVACFATVQWLLTRRHTHPTLVWGTPPLVLLWANVHGSFVLAIGLIGLAWLDDVRTREPGAWRLVWLGIASIAATMITPDGARSWMYVWELSRNPNVRALVTEWQPPSFDSYNGAAFLLSVPLVVILFVRWRADLRWPAFLSAASFLLIGLMSVRGVCWWAMVMPVMLAGTRLGREATDPDDPVHGVNRAIVAVLGAAALLMLVPWVPFRSADEIPSARLTEAPAGITKALRGTLRDNERVFNAQRWGSWFEYALPDHPVVVDSRIELFPDSVWRRYAQVSRGEEGWQRVLHDWQVRVVVVSPAQQRGLLARIAVDTNWTEHFRDDDGAIFVRR